MKISRIYICTHRYDLFFTRMCIASIRYWYPVIPISLIVDHSVGRFPIDTFRRKWNVELYDNGGGKYGWGFGKFEPLFLNHREKFLVVDADTVFTGRVLEKLDASDADFIVDEEVQPLENLNKRYFALDEVRKLFPNYRYPGYSFNTGQWVGTSGLLTKQDFDPLVIWGDPPRGKYPNVFFHGDQGILNYILHCRQQQGAFKVERMPLMIWPEGGNGDFIQLETIKAQNDEYPFIIHWAGMKFEKLSQFPRADIMEFYRRVYLSKYNVLKSMSDDIYLNYLGFERRIKLKIKTMAKSS